MTLLEFTVPLKTVSGSNVREHWAVRAKRVKAERRKVWAKWPRPARLPILLRVTMTRLGGRELDDDNLRAALKGVRDQVAAQLGVDDRTPLVHWDYEQRPGGEAGVLVRVETNP